RDYIFGPNTHLEKIDIQKNLGRHKVIYKIPSMPLLGGTYQIDVGIFSNEGIVNIDYKQGICEFKITNKYFSEGKFYINHEWEVVK
ncbi:MAG: Wzt carbohydrate-binding domain-containing protein, partial [Clostridium sp.]